MPSRPFPTSALLIAAALWLAPGCATKERTRPLFPPAADLKVEPKPRLDPSALDSEAALDAHDIALETWGDAGWAAVARICRWAKANGMTVSCEATRSP
jgi:hypothetical protein